MKLLLPFTLIAMLFSNIALAHQDSIDCTCDLIGEKSQKEIEVLKEFSADERELILAENNTLTKEELKEKYELKLEMLEEIQRRINGVTLGRNVIGGIAITLGASGLIMMMQQESSDFITRMFTPSREMYVQGGSRALVLAAALGLAAGFAHMQLKEFEELLEREKAINQAILDQLAE